MRSFPIPFNEEARQTALSSLEGLHGDAEPIFDEIVATVRALMDVPTALVSLVEEDRQWFKARDGLDLAEMPRSYAICAHTIMSADPLVIPDTHADPRFIGHPVVVNPPHVRFYVGAPIILSSGFRVGSLCAIDYVSRDQPAADIVRVLSGLAKIVAAALEAGGGTSDGATREAQPREAAARDEFLALVSHELRTPLNGLLGLASLLDLRVADPQNRKLLDGGRKSGELLNRIVERILLFTEATTGELGLSEEVVDLRDLILRSIDHARPVAEAAGKSISATSSAPPGELLADPPQLELALACVLGNAVAHGGSRIEVDCQRGRDGEIVLTVRDDGPGIAKDRLAGSMEPFGVGCDVQRRSEGGIGLGLPLTKRLVELHGGELQVLRDGGWTVVSIRLPNWRAR